MPYSSPDELPQSVRDALPIHGQRIYLDAFNSAFEWACKDRQDIEECCAKIAWSSVKEVYSQNTDGTWKPIPSQTEEAGNVNELTTEFEETLSPANLSRNFIKEDGTARVRIIKPGWGSSGYYSEQMLARDAAKAYTPGLHMYLDHPTSAEDKARPERSVKDLAGVVAGNVAYENEGPWGPGVYADAHILKPYRDMLSEMAPFIGLSHRAQGKSKTGSAEGRNGPIIESLEKAYSVDFVTLPGAGGGLVQMHESWRETHENTQRQETTNNKEKTMKENFTLTELKESRKDLVEAIRTEVLTEIQESDASKKAKAEVDRILKESDDLKKENARLVESNVIRDAVTYVTKALEKTSIPELAKPRIAESVARQATIKDGALDETAFKTVVETAIKTETEFYGKLLETGKVKGFGAGAPGNQDTMKALKESFKEDFLSQGKSPEVAEKMAEIAARGR